MAITSNPTQIYNFCFLIFFLYFQFVLILRFFFLFVLCCVLFCFTLIRAWGRAFFLFCFNFQYCRAPYGPYPMLISFSMFSPLTASHILLFHSHFTAPSAITFPHTHWRCVSSLILCVRSYSSGNGHLCRGLLFFMLCELGSQYSRMRALNFCFLFTTVL